MLSISYSYAKNCILDVKIRKAELNFLLSVHGNVGQNSKHCSRTFIFYSRISETHEVNVA